MSNENDDYYEERISVNGKDPFSNNTLHVW